MLVHHTPPTSAPKSERSAQGEPRHHVSHAPVLAQGFSTEDSKGGAAAGAPQLQVWFLNVTKTWRIERSLGIYIYTHHKSYLIWTPTQLTNWDNKSLHSVLKSWFFMVQLAFFMSSLSYPRSRHRATWCFLWRQGIHPAGRQHVLGKPRWGWQKLSGAVRPPKG